MGGLWEVFGVGIRVFGSGVRSAGVGGKLAAVRTQREVETSDKITRN